MRIIIKIGTSTLAYATGHPNIRHIENFCKVVWKIPPTHEVHHDLS